MDNKKEVKKDSLFLKAIPYFDKYGILILLLIMIIALHIMQPEVFLSWRNITNVFKQISWQSMLALGVFIVIVTAGIDLSVGSIMMLSLMVLAGNSPKSNRFGYGSYDTPRTIKTRGETNFFLRLNRAIVPL